MAISKIKSAGITSDFDNTLTAADIAANAIGISELDNTATGISSTNHKVPTFADDSARDSAIGSPTVGMLIYNTASNAVQQYNGTWSTIAPAPNITSVSGGLNNDSDSTITIFGTNFNSTSIVKMFNASAGGTQIGSNATTTFVSATNLKAVFGAGSIGASGSTAYIEVDNSGAANRFATAITVNADPTVVHAGATGTGANTTNHLGTYGGTSTGGPSDSYTKLLLNFDRGGGSEMEDSSNAGSTGHNIEASGNTYIQASPFGDGKSAIKFDGSGDRLAVPDHADFHFGTGDWTIEAWIKIADHGENTIYAQYENAGGFTNQRCIWFRTKTGGALAVQISSNGSNTIWSEDTTNVVPIGIWTHVALVKSNSGGSTGNVTPYINGAEGQGWSTSAYGLSMHDSTSTPTIGSTLYDASQDFNGYMDEIRISKGIARYRLGFDPPTTRFTQDSYTSWLVHSNLAGGGSSFSGYNTFTDSSSSGRTITAAGTPIHSTLYNGTENSVFPSATGSTGGKKFGSHGAYFDGTGDFIYVNIDSGDWGFGSGNFVIDMWVRPDRVDAQQTLIGVGASGPVNHGFYMSIEANAKLKFQIKPTSGAEIAATSSASIVINTWTHVAVVRDTNDMKLFINGVQDGSTADVTGKTITDPTSDLGIGRLGEYNGSYYKGYIDILRISKGTNRGWASGFTIAADIYGGALAQTIPTITFTGSATQLASDEDIEFTSVANTTKASTNQHLTDTGIGLTLTNLTGGDKNKATLTGTIASSGGTTHTNMPLKLQVRKTLGNAAYANASRTVTFSSSTTTAGLAPAMPVTGTGIPASTTITSVDTSTTITLSANPTGGTLTGQSLIFSDLTRVSHQYNGSDTLDNTDAMYTIGTAAAGAAAPVLFNARRYMGNAVVGTYYSEFGFAPDMIVTKQRLTDTRNWVLSDCIRGMQKPLSPNRNVAAYTDGNATLSFESDGFTVGNTAEMNASNKPFITWAWKAGGRPNANGKRMTDGVETLLVSGTDYDSGMSSLSQTINTAGKFSITKFSGNSGNRWFKHGLGAVKPDFYMIKCHNAVHDWRCWHSGFSNHARDYITWNTGDAVASHSTIWGDNGPGTNGTIHAGEASVMSGDAYICYAWKAVSGVSAFGSYTGTSGGNKVTLDFRPRFIMTKCSSNYSSYTSWAVYDAFREGNWGTSGTVTLTTPTTVVYVDQSKVEGQRAGDSGVPTASLIIYDDGFKFFEGNDETNAHAGWTYIYCAFA